MTTIAIDLGTTNSCLAIWEAGKPRVIENSEGARTTPSIVGFKNGEQLVGSTARRQAVTNPLNTIFDAKRLIGRRFDDPKVQEDIRTLPYQVVKADNGDAWIEVEGRKTSPQEIGAMVLGKLKADAEAYLGKPVTQAIITVPAYFNDAQRQATRDAGRIAGLEVLRIINEPTAAAMAFSVEKNGRGKIVVADCGGGTHDISILDIDENVIEVLSTNGDTHLGGSDFDNRIIDFLVAEYKKEHGSDLTQDKMAMQRVKEAAEKAKIELSSLVETEINLPYISADASGPKHLVTKLSRAKFENMTQDLVERVIAPCRVALKDAGLSPADIREVLLVGGSTRIPSVQKAIADFFGKEPNRGVNPDEAVALGAAVQAGVLSGDVKDVLLLDVTPLSLGLETLGGVMTRLIEKNTTIPVKKEQIFSTAQDNQNAVTIRVFQGERSMAADNKLLGQFDLTDIPPAPRGVPQIEVSFNISADGLVEVSAKNMATNKAQSISIQANGGLSEAEIEEMVKTAEANAEADQKRRELVEARNQAEGLVSSSEKQLADNGLKIPEDLRKEVEEAIAAVKGVMDSDLTEEIRDKTNDLMNKQMKIGEYLYQQKPAEDAPTATAAD